MADVPNPNPSELPVSPASQTLLARFAAVISVVALVMVGVVAATSGGNSGDGSSTSAAAAPVAVALSEFQISPSTITVPKGGSLDVTNNGSMVHNLAVTGQSPALADLQPGANGKLDVSSLAVGEYEIFCAIPGHKDSGMVAKLIISDGTTAGNAAAGDAASADHSDHTVDLSTLSANDPQAKILNKKFEKGMNDGVNTFLDFATKYLNGDMKTGNTPLEHKVLADGTWRFDLTAAITDWEVSPGKVVKAWTYNGQVPGPWIKVPENQKVEVVLKNELPISTDIHLHGVDTPNDMDGVAPITQKYVEPGTSFTYKFTTANHPQLGMYHAHMHGHVSIVNGLFADFQVGDVPLPRGKTVGNMAIPADLKIAQEIPMVLNDAGVIGLSLNGKGFPETAPVVIPKGKWVLIDLFNEGLLGHPMHLHRQPQIVVAKDGFPLDAPYRADTIWVGPGERYSVLVYGEEPGKWAFHCHILNHAENDDGLTGMVTVAIVQ